jgi:hypothetical protein
MANLRKMSDSEVAEWTAGWKPGTTDRILGMAELDRRKNRGNTIRGWIAIGISVLALLVSIVAMFVKRAA